MSYFPRFFSALCLVVLIVASEASRATEDLGLGSNTGGAAVDSAGESGGGPASTVPHIFVIALENKDSVEMFQAPYVSSLIVKYGHATNYSDLLPSSVPSEPHYLRMEAGTHEFGDYTFTSNDDASASNSTNDTAHIVTKLKEAGNGKTWRAYQEGLSSTTGACPITSDEATFYAAKHNPFVFFQDVSGSPPSKTNAECAAHHKDYSSLAADLAANTVATYNFITPNQCNDMHGAEGCNNGCKKPRWWWWSKAGCINAGDDWLKNNVPPIIDFMDAHGGVLILVWDESSSTKTMPFIIVGPHIKPGFSSATELSHKSFVKSVERMLGLPVNPRVAAANDFGEFFQPGYYP